MSVMPMLISRCVPAFVIALMGVGLTRNILLDSVDLHIDHGDDIHIHLISNNDKFLFTNVNYWIEHVNKSFTCQKENIYSFKRVKNIYHNGNMVNNDKRRQDVLMDE